MREIIYEPVKARCPDGVVRTVRARASIYGGLYPDTAFSIPARVKVKGKTVTGYITPADGLAWIQDHEPKLSLQLLKMLIELEFHPFAYRKNHAVFKGE